MNGSTSFENATSVFLLASQSDASRPRYLDNYWHHGPQRMSPFEFGAAVNPVSPRIMFLMPMFRVSAGSSAPFM